MNEDNRCNHNSFWYYGVYGVRRGASLIFTKGYPMFNFEETRIKHIQLIASTPRQEMAAWHPDLLEVLLDTHIGLVVDTHPRAMDERETSIFNRQCEEVKKRLAEGGDVSKIDYLKSTCDHAWGIHGNGTLWSNVVRSIPQADGTYNVLVGDKELEVGVEYKNGAWVTEQTVTHWKAMPEKLMIVD